MTRVYVGLTSTEGDRLGHLVRGVQMLRSYGGEAKVMRYSDVLSSAGEPPALMCLLECNSTATLEGLQGIARETEWALGHEPNVLTVTIVQYGDTRAEAVPGGLLALLDQRQEPGSSVFLARAEFTKLCDWGQNLTNGETEVMGEWPSATGR